MLESIKKFFIWTEKYITWKVEPKGVIKGALGKDIALLYEYDGEYLISYIGIPQWYGRCVTPFLEKYHSGDETVIIKQDCNNYLFFITKSKEKYLEEVKRIETEVEKAKLLLSKISEKYSFENAYEYHSYRPDINISYVVYWKIFYNTDEYYEIYLTPRTQFPKTDKTYQWFLSNLNIDINDFFKR